MTETLNFKISGEFITEHSRSLIFEKSYTHAVKFLTDSIIGFSDANAKSVLTGVKKLIGINDIELVNDNGRGFKSRLKAHEKFKRAKKKEQEINLDGIYGWITNTGTFYACEYGGHLTLVDALISDIRGIPSYGNAEEYAEYLGWIKITKSTLSDDAIILHEANRMTLAAANTLKRWCYRHGQEIPHWYEDKISQA